MTKDHIETPQATPATDAQHAIAQAFIAGTQKDDKPLNDLVLIDWWHRGRASIELEEKVARLEAETAALRTQQQASERYRHKKTGGVYRVISDTALLEADKTAAVVYQSEADGVVWIRSAEQFYDGRFERIDAPAAGADRP